MQEEEVQEEVQEEVLEEEVQEEVVTETVKTPKKYSLAEITKIAKENKIVLSYLNKETGKRAKKTLQQLIDECKENELI